MKDINILSISNYIPEEIIDIKRFNSYYGNQRIENYCTYAQNFLSQVIEDDNITGAVIPNSCDSIRIAADYLKKYTNKYIYQIKHPLKFSESSISEYANEIKKYKSSLEGFFDINISNELIFNRINCLNKKYGYINQIYSSLENISYYDYLKDINISFNEPLENFERIFNKEYKKSKPYNNKIYLIGPYLSDLDIIKKIEDFGGNIVGDDLTNSKRYFSFETAMPAYFKNDIFEEIAYRNLSKHPSPTLNNFKVIIKNDLAEIKKKDIKKVIFIYQKFCDPHEYIYPALKKELDNEGISSIKIQLENNINSMDNLEIKLDTFLNMF